MTLPNYTVTVDGETTVVADQLNTYIQSGGGLVSDIRNFIGITGIIVYVLGYATANDGGQGHFYWNATGTAPDDGGVTTVIPNGSSAGNGEWTRVPAVAAASVVPISVVNLVTPGTFTVNTPTGATSALIEAWGAGGGGGFGGTGCASGGSAGAYGRVMVGPLPASISGTIGTGGPASSGAADGTAGGQSTVTIGVNVYVVGGGPGGHSEFGTAAPSPAVATASGPWDQTIIGQQGQYGLFIAGIGGVSGNGGIAPLGGIGGTGGGGIAGNGGAPGGGGGGSASSEVAGAGGNGAVRITYY